MIYKMLGVFIDDKFNWKKYILHLKSIQKISICITNIVSKCINKKALYIYIIP